MYRASQSIRRATGRDGAIILDIRQGHMFNLNVVGSRILELLQSGFTESQIVDEISGAFVVSRDIAAADLREFLQELVTRGLIEEHAEDPAL